jgi:hypothetical protein
MLGSGKRGESDQKLQMAARFRLKVRRCLSIMRKPHVNPAISGFDLARRDDYVMRS